MMYVSEGQSAGCSIQTALNQFDYNVDLLLLPSTVTTRWIWGSPNTKVIFLKFCTEFHNLLSSLAAGK